MKRFWRFQTVLLSALMMQGVAVTSLSAQPKDPASPLPYSEFLQKLDKKEVKEVKLQNNNLSAEITLQDGTKRKVDLPNLDRNRELIKTLRENRVAIEVLPPRTTSSPWQLLITIGIPVALILFVILLFRRVANAPGGPAQTLSFGRSKARFSPESKTGVVFEDVAGIDDAKEELQEVVTFLKQPDRFTSVGARIPRGVLLIGPPGTGKTMLARAIAGEAGVPFFSLSGSEFVEMFVGVGASRVRDLFGRAKENAPCLIFIDEIDAVGRQRGGGYGGGNDEREQTLNQLLSEMDGFQGNTGVIVLAATNRPDVLDAALLRPGRFDRQIMVDYPDFKGRLAILKVHARNKKLDEHVSLEAVARRTPGFAGADLANLLNEAAILTARRRKDLITELEIADALDRVKVGVKLKHLSDNVEKVKTAYHEIGHALVSTLLKDAYPLDKVTIIPRSSGPVGFASFVPPEELGLESRAAILAKITVFMGGRAADEVVFGPDEIDEGAGSDIVSATSRARLMVTQLGMSNLGLTALERPNRNWMSGIEYSEEVASQIDQQVRQIIQSCYEQAKSLILEHRDLCDYLVEVLLEKETIDGEEFRKIVSQFTEIPEKPVEFAHS